MKLAPVCAVACIGAAAFIILLPGAARALCPDAPARPAVTVLVEEKPLDFVTDETRRDMTARAAGDPGAARAQQGAFVGGMAAGAIRLHHDVVFGRATDVESGAGCLWINEVRVRLVIAPVVHIAEDLQHHDCWYQEIYRHELKHVAADRALLRKYEGRIKDGLGMVFAQPAAYVSGAYPVAEAAMTRARMHADLAPPLGALFTMMMRERAVAQAAIDTPEEYSRVAALCRAEILPGES